MSARQTTTVPPLSAALSAALICRPLCRTDKGCVVVVWRADLYQREALRQLPDTFFYSEVDIEIFLPATAIM